MQADTGSKLVVADAGAQRVTQQKRTVVLTERDRAINAWLTRHGVATAEQLCRRFFGSMSATWRRVARLESIGLVRRDATWVHGPRVVRATRDGARFADVDLRASHLDYFLLNHQLALVDLSEHLLAEHTGATWTTERELRRDQLRTRGETAPPWSRRTPDGLLHLANAERVVIELDLTPKRTQRLDALVRSYARNREIDGVWWYLPSEAAVARLQGVARSRGLEQLVVAHLYRRERG